MPARQGILAVAVPMKTSTPDWYAQRISKPPNVQSNGIGPGAKRRAIGAAQTEAEYENRLQTKRPRSARNRDSDFPEKHP